MSIITVENKFDDSLDFCKVVLAAAICTKNGRPLLSRQFSEMTKSRIEGLLSAFPKLIGNGKQHTFIETENIRYVYQPLEQLYLVLITNKNSNILEDLETLHLLAKLVPEYSSFDEADVSRKAFDIIFTFDEVIAMGYKERVTVQQIKHFISMESHEEERDRMDRELRESEAKKNANKKIKEIEKLRQDDLARGGSGRVGGGIGGGMGGGGGMGSGSMSPSYSSDQHYSGGSGYSSSNPSPRMDKRESTPPTKSQVPSKEGMKLSKSIKKSSLAQVLKEEKVVEKEEELEALLSSDNTGSLAPPTPAIPTEAVHIVVEETVTIVMENDGTINTLDIKGVLDVNVNDPNLGRVKVSVQMPNNSNFQCITHPNIDKPALTSSSTLRLKDGQKAFPAGGVLKWRYRVPEDSMIPLKVNCWPSPSGQSTTVNLEYESVVQFPLKNIVISIPNPSSAAPSVDQFDGLYEYDSKAKNILWKIPHVDNSNRTGSLVFTVKGATSNFFPVHVNFVGNNSLFVTVAEVIQEETNKPTKFSTETTLMVDSYEIN
ncbi:Coatomer delta subunit [Heterostelium album PN500]|uniref:Coatomer subunit delta n=1 Tax=Heterostelium pallidum (strain ATCC 26659 / Pp 5 / PN500) TaxID=670386 RepID=D3BTM5_HETP5|nr:Coatomer delta subunit [Heterostelium album PN500]EFA75442.1 Coatomer delta subunit [Heterostelium album PN500]|eukprot:XP_020427576.1 Coatomer delta subunit [Heterostelium album PN500]